MHSRRDLKKTLKNHIYSKLCTVTFAWPPCRRTALAWAAIWESAYSMISEKANLCTITHYASFPSFDLIRNCWRPPETAEGGGGTSLKHAIFVQGAFFLTLNDFPSIDYAHVLCRRSHGGYKRSHMLQPWALVLDFAAVSCYVMLPRICPTVWKSVLVLTRWVLTGLTHEFNHIWSTGASCCWLCAWTLMKII